jgi:hypothetical protein
MPHRNLCLVPACAAAPLLLAATLAGCQPAAPPAPLSAAQPLDVAGAVSHALGRHAVNALVIPLLDDAEPPRFTQVALPLMCARDGDVSLDGAPLAEGAVAPAGSFTLRWRLDDACPFGPEGPLLRGEVDVLVLRDDAAGLQAVVRPRAATPLAHAAP